MFKLQTCESFDFFFSSKLKSDKKLDDRVQNINQFRKQLGKLLLSLFLMVEIKRFHERFHFDGGRTLERASKFMSVSRSVSEYT